MSKRDQTPTRPPRLRRAAILLLAFVLAGVAIDQGVRLVRRLPLLQIERAIAQQKEQGSTTGARFRESLSAAPLRVREAVELANFANRFTTALFDPEVLKLGREDLVTRVARHRNTELGRLYMIAYVLLERERSGATSSDGWEILQRYIETLNPRGSALPSLEADLIQHAADVWRTLGCDPGTAQMQAVADGSGFHGPFLQFVSVRLEELARAREAAGDADAAQRCRTLNRRLLKDWITTPASAGLRLLAADLLSDALRADPRSATAERNLIDGLTQWRKLYHARAPSGATRLPILSPRLDAPPAPELHKNLGGWLAKLLWLATGLIIAAVAALLLGPLWLHSRRIEPFHGAMYVGVAFAIVLAALSRLGEHNGWAIADLRRDFSDKTGMPRIVFYAGAVAVMMLVYGGIAFNFSRGRCSLRFFFARCGAVASYAALVLGLMALVCCWRAESLRQQLEHDVALALKPDEGITFISAEETRALLAPLRAWEP